MNRSTVADCATGDPTHVFVRPIALRAADGLGTEVLTQLANRLGTHEAEPAERLAL